MRRVRRSFFSGWVWFVVIAIPVLFLGLGAWMLMDAVNFRQIAWPGQGRVVELIRDTSGDGISYSPVIEYEGLDGQIYRGQTHISSSSYNYRIGERVEILYSFDDPGEVRINSFFSLYGLGLIFAAVGGFFLLVLSFVRRKMSAPIHGYSELARQEAEARARWEAEAREQMGQEPEQTTDPSQHGHVHKPKPKQQPTVRRMR